VSAAERRLERLAWRTLVAAGQLAGPRAARGVAATALRVRARTAAGWLDGVHRVAARPAPGAPPLTRLPEAWWTTSPQVRVRRLGLRLDLDLRDNLQRTLYATGTYEPALRRFLHQELRPGDVLADVGAHIGVHALTAAARLRQLGGGTVIAFEPANDSAARLRAAAARNHLAVTVVETALGAAPGTAELHANPSYDPADTGVRSLHGHGPLVQSVPVTSFDAWAAASGVDHLDLIKLDVEGSELAAIKGMTGALRRLRPRALVVELKQPMLDQAAVDAQEVRDLLSDLGYTPTGQVFPVANELWRPKEHSPPPPAASLGPGLRNG
jgi:FkbM family methyltransferase